MRQERARPTTVSPLVVPEIVVFPAEVDISNADRLGADLRAALRPGVSVVVADMTLTDFCDSSGLRQLVVAHNRAARNDAQLRVVVTSDHVRRVMHFTGADQVLDVRDSMVSALTRAERADGRRTAG